MLKEAYLYFFESLHGKSGRGLKNKMITLYNELNNIITIHSKKYQINCFYNESLASNSWTNNKHDQNLEQR